jgi:transcriptional regulator with XRE-family HTH domain
MNELEKRLLSDIENGKSRRQIALKAGVSLATIRKILRGEKVKHYLYEKLATNYLHLPIDEVYRMAGMLPPMYSPGGWLNRDWMLGKIWEAVARLSDSDQALVLAEVLRISEKYQTGTGDEETNS